MRIDLAKLMFRRARLGATVALHLALCACFGCTSRAPKPDRNSASQVAAEEKLEAAPSEAPASDSASGSNQELQQSDKSQAASLTADRPAADNMAMKSSMPSADSTNNKDSTRKTDVDQRADSHNSDGTLDSKRMANMNDGTAFPSTAQWTSQRLILLAPGGPKILDVKLAVGETELQKSLDQSTEKLASEVHMKLDGSAMWTELLQHPLVKSGWIGNLVPKEDQVGQVLALYDTNRDERVQLEEFQAFITRGLSRSGLVRLVREPTTAMQARLRILLALSTQIKTMS